MALEFSQQTMQRFEELVARYPVREAALVPVLRMAQEEFGHLSGEAIVYVSSLMAMPPTRVYGAATFYSMLHLKPVGTYHIQVCRTLCCSLMGAERILDHLEKRLGVKPGETTADGRFTLCAVECLALCGTGPVMQVNDDDYENLTEKKVEEILQRLK